MQLDLNRPQTYSWQQLNDEVTVASNCSEYLTSFLKKNSGRQTGLASVPGSGELWIRYLIEGLTGVYTGDLYKVSNYIQRGFEYKIIYTITFLLEPGVGRRFSWKFGESFRWLHHSLQHQQAVRKKD